MTDVIKDIETKQPKKKKHNWMAGFVIEKSNRDDLYLSQMEARRKRQIDFEKTKRRR